MNLYLTNKLCLPRVKDTLGPHRPVHKGFQQTPPRPSKETETLLSVSKRCPDSSRGSWRRPGQTFFPSARPVPAKAQRGLGRSLPAKARLRGGRTPPASGARPVQALLQQRTARCSPPSPGAVHIQGPGRLLRKLGSICAALPTGRRGPEPRRPRPRPAPRGRLAAGRRGSAGLPSASCSGRLAPGTSRSGLPGHV